MRATRPQNTDVQPIKENVQWGAGPRAGQSLILAAKAYALLNGRFAVVPEDVKSVIFPTLRHRVLLNYKAEANAISTDAMIEILLQETPFLSKSL